MHCRTGQPLSRAYQRRLVTAAFTAAGLLGTSSLLAANAQWNSNPSTDDWVAGAGDTNWSTGVGTFPGATGTTTNQDTATLVGSSLTTIDINQAVNIKSINIGAAATLTPQYTIGAAGLNAGNAISLSTGGAITLVNFGTSVGVQTFNAPLILQPASSTMAGTYTFANASPNGSLNALRFNGNISGGLTSSTITLLLGSSPNTAPNVIAGDISNGQAAQLNLEKQTFTGGTWSLTGNNTYTGTTIIQTGTLEVLSINSVGGPNAKSSSSLGAPTTSASGTITIGNNSQNGGLRYVGSGESTNRIFRFSANTTNTVDASGAGPLTITSSAEIGGNAAALGITFTGTSAVTLENEFAGDLINGNSGARVVTITKANTGTWVLSGNNSYSGGTLITGGKLVSNHANALGTGGVNLGAAHLELRNASHQSLNSAFTLSGSATTLSGPGSLTFSGSLSNATVNTFNVGTGLTINGDGGGLSGTVNNRILTFTGGGTVALNGSIGNNMAGGTSTASGITYNGTGSLTLAGDNTFNGNFTASNGQVFVNNSTGSGSGFGSVIVSASRFAGTGRVAPTVSGATLSFGSNAVLAPGDASGFGELELDLSGTSGVATMGTSSRFSFRLGSNGGTLASPGDSSRLLVTGGGDQQFIFNANSVTFTGIGQTGVYKLFDTDLEVADTDSDVWGKLTYDETTGLVSVGLVPSLLAGGTADFYVGTASNGGDVGDIYVSVAGIPEPATMSLLALGAAGLLRRTRRRSN